MSLLVLVKELRDLLKEKRDQQTLFFLELNGDDIIEAAELGAKLKEPDSVVLSCNPTQVPVGGHLGDSGWWLIDRGDNLRAYDNMRESSAALANIVGWTYSPAELLAWLREGRLPS